MFRTRPPWFAAVCVLVWAVQLALIAIAFHWIGSVGSSAQRWWELAAVAVTMGLGACLLIQLPKAMQWRPRRSIRPSAEVVAERRRIAQDLHDHLGSQLVSAMSLFGKDHPRERDLRALLEKCLLDLRFIVDSMHGAQDPLPERMARLRHRIQPALDQRGISMLWDVDIPVGPRLPNPSSADHILAIVQEALSNTVQHAAATEVSVCARYIAPAGIWYWEVCDNGLGIPAADGNCDNSARAAGFGLKGMHTRARLAGGELQILQREGGGTRVRVILPTGGGV